MQSTGADETALWNGPSGAIVRDLGSCGVERHVYGFSLLGGLPRSEMNAKRYGDRRQGGNTYVKLQVEDGRLLPVARVQPAVLHGLTRPRRGAQACGRSPSAAAATSGISKTRPRSSKGRSSSMPSWRKSAR
jgi:hypothetical protein